MSSKYKKYLTNPKVEIPRKTLYQKIKKQKMLNNNNIEKQDFDNDNLDEQDFVNKNYITEQQDFVNNNNNIDEQQDSDKNYVTSDLNWVIKMIFSMFLIIIINLI